jgi:hypothetical protein
MKSHKKRKKMSMGNNLYENFFSPELFYMFCLAGLEKEAEKLHDFG